MPHLQLELDSGSAARLDVAAVLRGLVAELSDIETVDPSAVKAYARKADRWAMGRGAPEGFIHLTVAVLDGRGPDVLSQMADRLYACLQTACGPALGDGTVSLTLEVREMARATYRKSSPS